MPSIPTYPCTGCKQPARVDTMKQAWLATPLGTTVVYAHHGCERASIVAIEAIAGKPVKVINEPQTRGER